MNILIIRSGISLINLFYSIMHILFALLSIYSSGGMLDFHKEGQGSILPNCVRM